MLSHFSLTPQEPTSEMKIVKNAPAVTMEETVPVTLSTSAQLAPEEVRKVRCYFCELLILISKRAFGVTQRSKCSAVMAQKV